MAPTSFTPSFRLPRSVALLMAGVFAATALASCGGGRVHTKQDMQTRKQQEAMERERAAEAALATQDSKWKGATVGLEEEFQLLDTDTVKLDNHDYKVQLVRTTWSEMETPKGVRRDGTAVLLVTKGEQMKQISIDEAETSTVLGFRIEVRHAYEQYDEDRADYVPLAKVVVHRN